MVSVGVLDGPVNWQKPSETTSTVRVASETTNDMSASDLTPISAPPQTADPALSREIELFLYHDAMLLDAWRLREWFALFTPDCEYLVPSTDRPDGDAERDLFFVRDDWFLLSQRIDAMTDGTAWTESPHSITRRIISNVLAWENPDGSIAVNANFVVYRSALANLDVYPGSYVMRLLRGGSAGFEIQLRRSTLSMAQLRPHGRVSVIL
jgi:p-cumate 2,3-dioxygenase subunit beta